MASGPLVELVDVVRNFDAGAVAALRGANLAIDAGQSLAIVGPSGSGKSTLINILSGIDAPDTGEVRWRGKPILGRAAWRALRAKEIGIVFQEFLLLPTLNVEQNVEAALADRGLPAPERARLSREALERVGMGHRLRHMPYKLSGGERQRTAIARAIVGQPVLLLADEPTGNLDRANAQAVADLLFDLVPSSGATLVLVTHDTDLAARCERQVSLVDGRIEAHEPAERVSA